MLFSPSNEGYLFNCLLSHFMSKYFRDELNNKLLLVSEARANRPHLKKSDKKKCPFCSGQEKLTEKATLELPDKNWSVRAFPNKYPFVKRSGKFSWKNNSAPGFGDHEVIVETNKHRELFEDYSDNHLELLWEAYLNRFNDFSSRKQVEFVCLLKNHGKKSGASISHEHSQIVSYPFVPDKVKRFTTNQCPLCNPSKLGITIFSTKNFRIITLFNALVAGECWIVPKKHVKTMQDVDGVELLKALQETVKRIKKFTDSYNFVFINSPKNGDLHFHVEVFPRVEQWGAIELGLGIYLNAVGARKARELLR